MKLPSYKTGSRRDVSRTDFDNRQLVLIGSNADEVYVRIHTGDHNYLLEMKLAAARSLRHKLDEAIEFAEKLEFTEKLARNADIGSASSRLTMWETES
jgi:hypothetical protein